MKPFNIFLISADTLTLDGIKNFLSIQNNISVKGYTDNFDVLPDLNRNGQSSILLVDDSGSEKGMVMKFIGTVVRKNPDVKIIVCTNSNDVSYLKILINRKVKGIISKQASKEKLLLALKTIGNGNVYFDSTIVFSIFNDNILLKLYDIDDVDRLSKREQSVLRLMSFGLRNREIAKELGISVKTVENFKEKIKGKLGMKKMKDLYKLISY